MEMSKSGGAGGASDASCDVQEFLQRKVEVLQKELDETSAKVGGGPGKEGK